MRLLLCVLFCCGFLMSNGQAGISPQGEVRDAWGQPLTTKNVYGVEGTPYLSDVYLPGRLTIDGTKYSNVSIKLNLEKNIVFFEKEGMEMIPTGSVSVVEFVDPASGTTKVFKNGFPDINKNTALTFYQVLDSGKATLLKHFFITYRESRTYGEATTVKRYEQIKNYYIFINNSLVQVKKNESVLDVLKDKKDDVEKYISANKLKMTREEDLRAVIAYYNSK